MKSFAIILSSVLVLGACSSEPNVVHLRTEKGKKETKIPVNADKMLTLEVKGMTCEMGCGGSIRKELKASGGVARVEFDFIEGEKVQTTKIYFDSDKVNEEEMMEIVTSMNDQQFTAIKVSSEGISTTSTTPVENRATKEDEKVKISTSSYNLPNLFDLLSGIIH